MGKGKYICAVVLLTAFAVHGENLVDTNSYHGLAADDRAHRVGDSVTVLVYEAASATSRANTTADRSSSIDARASDLDDIAGVTYSADNRFDGGGVERRSGEVVARVSVTVREVRDNGDLLVQGEQRIALNNETQQISILGWLRPQDILADNTALSSRLADAKIEFKGKGMLSSREKPGILIRFFQWLL